MEEKPADSVPVVAEPEQISANSGTTFAVKVYAPFQVYYEGVATSISSVNETGPFDILPRHHNFLCMLVPSMLIVRTPEGEKKIKVSRALMHVKSDTVVVFMDV